MRLLSAVFLLLFSLTGFAAPQQTRLVYQVLRNGQPFATVTETFRQQDGRYQIESVTEGLGAYVLLGKRKLKSEGVVTDQGLRPLHFSLQQGSKNPITADFDWDAASITQKSGNKSKPQPLAANTQDLLSFAYQFMFQPPQAGEVNVTLTTGKKLRDYRYVAETLNGQETQAKLETPAGAFRALHLKNAEALEDGKELWLAIDKHHLVLRVLMKDDSGAELEQTLTSLHVE